MKKLIFVGLLAILIPVASAMAGGSERGKDFDRCDHGSWVFAGDSSPYVVGQWKLRDSFVDFTSIQPTIAPGTTPIFTDDTEFDFQNPTNLTLQLETAFFDEGGTFCGCDRRVLKPNGTVRYTMRGEEQAKLLSRTYCPSTTTQTDGMMKAIVFQKHGKHFCLGDAVLTGLQIHMNVTNSPQFRAETGLIKVRINQATLEEIKTIHEQCLEFLGPVVDEGK